MQFGMVENKYLDHRRDGTMLAIGCLTDQFLDLSCRPNGQGFTLIARHGSIHLWRPRECTAFHRLWQCQIRRDSFLWVADDYRSNEVASTIRSNCSNTTGCRFLGGKEAKAPGKSQPDLKSIRRVRFFRSFRNTHLFQSGS
jgi:hypothetical protein